MTRDWRKAIVPKGRGAAWGLALAALLCACAAQAQDSGSVSDYRLPPKASPAPPPVEGPVDSDHPVATPARPAPQPSPETAETSEPAPQITLPPTPAQAERRQPQPVQPVAGQPASAPTQPATIAPETPILPSAEPAPTASAPPTEPPAATPPSSSWWPWLLGGILALLVVGGLLWLRRKPAAPAEEEAPDEAAQPEPAASAPAVLAPIGQAAPKPAPQPVPAPAFDDGQLALRFEPQALRISLVYATLFYRLELANRRDATLSSLRVAGDIISAHASLPSWEQLSPDGAGLEQKHEIAALAPGESVSLNGELRLPLEAIRPVQAGATQLLVPLARFLVEAADAGADMHIFSVGQPSERQGGAMTPFRLDLGPQFFKRIDQREVDLARWLPVDAARQVG